MKFLIQIITVLLLTACSTGPSGAGRPTDREPQSSSKPKILVAAINEDPRNFWDGINGGGGGGGRELGHIVNQYLANISPDGKPVPRLVVDLPSVDKGTWNVLPDGRMEVTYKLRPDATWHDGAPFTAEDLAFSWEVGRDPEIPNGNQAAVRLISGVVAVDPQTAVATWTQTYAFADRLEHREFFPLPRHILEPAYRESRSTLIAQPYFSDEYVGLGPFKLVSWEHGSHMELVANDAYFLGRPKLDRVRVMFITDPNTALANMRAGTMHVFLPNGGPDWDQLEPIHREWEATGKGEVILERVRWEFAEPQKGALAQPGDLRDVRLRQALLLAINREELTQSLQGKYGGVANSWVHPSFAYYPQVKDTITEYPFDPRRAIALLAEVGWTPGTDGILQKAGARFEMRLSFEEARSKQANIVQQDWKTIGIDGQMQLLSNVLLRDAEARATAATGVQVGANPLGGASAVRRFAGDQIPTSSNRFAGTNRGQFSSAEWDDIGLRLRTSIDDDNRTKLERELLRVFSTDLPALALQFELQPLATAGLKGVIAVTGTPHTGNIIHTANIHEWDVR